MPRNNRQKVNTLSKHILELQADKGKLIDECRALEVENAELKSLLNCANCCEFNENECATCVEFSHFKCKGNRQLTKAKELLKRCYENYIYLEPLRSEIEQFLSEVEK